MPFGLLAPDPEQQQQQQQQQLIQKKH